jgi:hypothetical protein
MRRRPRCEIAPDNTSSIKQCEARVGNQLMPNVVRRHGESETVDFELLPRVGAGPLRFGMSRANVRSAMSVLGLPLENEHLTLDHFCENAIRAEYKDDSLSFVEFWCHGRTVPRYRGTDVFSVTAQELFTAIAGVEGGRHTYDPLEYLFPEQIVCLWAADRQYDLRTNQTRIVWATVGVGDARYLEAVRALDSGA